MKYFLPVLLFAAELHAAPLTITPNGSSASLVTAGIPFAACALRDVASFKLLNENGEEVAIFIKPTLFWPDSRCDGALTIRAVKIQFAYDPEQGEATYDWELAPRTLPDLQEATVAEVAAENSARAGYMEPAFFAINDPAYLVTTGLISPTTAAGKNDYDSDWYPEAFEKRVSTIDFATTTAENWLFDSVSTIYQQALRTGSVEQYREAYLEHEFYMGNFEVTNAANVGRWKLAEGDAKYVYLTPMKLHLALTGDDSWTPQENGVPHATAINRETFIRTIANKALGAQAIGKPYTDLAVRFTERETGFAFQQLLAAYELTNDSALRIALDSAVNNLHDMQINNPDGLGNHGYLSHSWDTHEGEIPAYVGMTPLFDGPVETRQTMTEMVVRNPLGNDYLKMPAGSVMRFKPYGPLDDTAVLSEAAVKNADGTLTLKFTAPVSVRSDQWAMLMFANDQQQTRSLNMTVDRAFSPWMQAIIADGLWQFYNLTDDVAVRTKISDLLLGFGRAITAYGIDGQKLAPALKSQIESAFGVSITANTGWNGALGITPYIRYVANTLSAGAPSSYLEYMGYDGAQSDQHSPESLFQIALAVRFETDPAKKAAMQAVAKAMTAWFAPRNINSTIKGPVRAFNWMNKQDAWGTYEAVLQLTE